MEEKPKDDNNPSSSEEEVVSDVEEEEIKSGVKDSDIDDSKVARFEDLVRTVEARVKETTNSKTFSLNILRILVSKQKKRFNLDGFDLDLTYVTDRIIAMGFPSRSFEKIYRNNMADVQRFLTTRHEGRHRVYNLCSERSYEGSYFNDNVALYPFDDHQAPPFHLIFEFCQDLDDWLKKDPANVAAVHCKAGKGRTGLMVCCYLLYSKMFPNAYEALRYYGMIRMRNKRGLTIPSQIRYVFYFEEALQKNWSVRTLPVKRVKLKSMRLTSIPNIGLTEPWFRVTCGSAVYNWKDDNRLFTYRVTDDEADFSIEDLFVVGDVRIDFFNNVLLSLKAKIFTAWFNTSFIDPNGILTLEKFMLDKAWKDKDHKIYASDFSLEIETSEAE